MRETRLSRNSEEQNVPISAENSYSNSVASNQRRTSEQKSTTMTDWNIFAWRGAYSFSARITVPMLLTNGFVKQILIRHVLFIFACYHIGNSISFRAAEYTFICQFNLTLFVLILTYRTFFC
jgi:hypothetical protein